MLKHIDIYSSNFLLMLSCYLLFMKVGVKIRYETGACQLCEQILGKYGSVANRYFIGCCFENRTRGCSWGTSHIIATLHAQRENAWNWLYILWYPKIENLYIIHIVIWLYIVICLYKVLPEPCTHKLHLSQRSVTSSPFGSVCVLVKTVKRSHMRDTMRFTSSGQTTIYRLVLVWGVSYLLIQTILVKPLSFPYANNPIRDCISQLSDRIRICLPWASGPIIGRELSIPFSSLHGRLVHLLNYLHCNFANSNIFWL
jgi:hypothetical protein